jgi:putative salt-induced outer membrane protein
MKTGNFGIIAALLSIASVAAVTGTSRSALADDAPTLPSETLKAKTATTGTNDVAKGGFATGALPSDDDPREATEASLGAGGLFSSGNARTVAVTSLGKFKMRRDEHQFTALASANFARAGKAGTPVDTTVENYQGMVRYDYFLTNNVALFLQTSARHDRFQGLDLRYNLDPGVAYFFINTKKQQLRIEGGYDLQYDVRRDASRVQTPDPNAAPTAPALPLLDKTKLQNNGRLFVGYDNKLYETVGFTSGLEYLQSLERLETYRLVFDIGLKSSIGGNFAIATTYTMRFENEPLPGVEQTDSIASVNLVYTLF